MCAVLARLRALPLDQRADVFLATTLVNKALRSIQEEQGMHDTTTNGTVTLVGGISKNAVVKKINSYVAGKITTWAFQAGCAYFTYNQAQFCKFAGAVAKPLLDYISNNVVTPIISAAEDVVVSFGEWLFGWLDIDEDHLDEHTRQARRAARRNRLREMYREFTLAGAGISLEQGDM